MAVTRPPVMPMAETAMDLDLEVTRAPAILAMLVAEPSRTLAAILTTPLAQTLPATVALAAQEPLKEGTLMVTSMTMTTTSGATSETTISTSRIVDRVSRSLAVESGCEVYTAIHSHSLLAMMCLLRAVGKAESWLIERATRPRRGLSIS